MRHIKYNIRQNKLLVLSAIFLVLLVAFVAIPTLSTYKIANPTSTISVWDGTISSSFSDGNGSEQNPYIISNGSDLLYLAYQLESTNYEGKYFLLNNDIVLNDGIFSYTKTHFPIPLTPNTHRRPQIMIFIHRRASPAHHISPRHMS